MTTINSQLADAIKLDDANQKTELKFPKDSITRLEVIQHSPPHNGRAYTNYNVKDLEFSLQDDGRTLKIFCK